MSYDLYTSPERFDLEIVSVLSDDNLSYEYDMLVVWTDRDGRVFYGTDSGCSCPSPFEDYRDLSDATEVTLDTWDGFSDLVNGCTAYDAADRTQTLSKVSALLRNYKEREDLDREVSKVQALGPEGQVADLLKIAETLEVTDESL